MRISPALALHWDSAALRSPNATQLNLTLEVTLSAVGGEGWIGLGFGESMVTAELAMAILPVGGRASVADLFAFDGYAAPSPVGDTSRYTVVADIVSFDASTRWVTFTRPLSTFPGGKSYFSSGPIVIVHAWRSGLELSYHQGNRGSCGRASSPCIP